LVRACKRCGRIPSLLHTEKHRGWTDSTLQCRLYVKTYVVDVNTA
jgi:hypothetical protein